MLRILALAFAALPVSLLAALKWARFPDLKMLSLFWTAAALGMLALDVMWRAGWLRWRWPWVALATSVVGAVISGSVFAVLLMAFAARWQFNDWLVLYPFLGVFYGLLVGFQSLAAPLGGLLFALLAPRLDRWLGTSS